MRQACRILCLRCATLRGRLEAHLLTSHFSSSTLSSQTTHLSASNSRLPPPFLSLLTTAIISLSYCWTVQSSTHTELPGDRDAGCCPRRSPTEDHLRQSLAVRSGSSVPLTLSCWDQFLPDEQVSFSSRRLDDETLLIIGAFGLPGVGHNHFSASKLESDIHLEGRELAG